MSSEGHIIHIGGGTAVGKDTVAELVKDKLTDVTGKKWEIKRGNLTENDPFNKLGSMLAKRGVTSKTIFTTIAALSIAHDIKNATIDRPTVLAGFNALRSAALHSAQTTNYEHIFVRLLSQAAKHVDASFILEAELAERQRRLLAREKITKFDRLLLEKPQEVLQMDTALLRLGMEYLGSVKIDTTTIKPSEVADNIVYRYLDRLTKDI